ncbi:hypothetical protein E6W36_15155 [Hankyongella ginsenosidimutans]|uniref:Calcium-binding protein n=1 Tax=Hankyongella ginsenosidimutans TaxID=1763828 RepID=A0A4D7CBX6_9SPHN|nr:hypothetical protein [Hankyongella ginsenosidimutans]QCI80366.1 hypothetical protein E6W36_15155 [Hankyongella ginsenosidimutans]
MKLKELYRQGQIGRGKFVILIWGIQMTDFLATGGDDNFRGSAGVNDIVSYANAASAIRVDLRIATRQNTLGSGNDLFLSIENLIGSAFADEFFGGAEANWFQGGGGNDRLTGGAGADTLNGGDGNDILYSDHEDFTDGATGTARRVPTA